MSASDLTNLSGLFKKTYGNLESLLPDAKHPFTKFCKTSSKSEGESFNPSVTLSHENGYTLTGIDNLVSFNPVASGAVKQASIQGHEMWVLSGIHTQAMQRAAKAGEAAFQEVTANRVAANLASHMRLREFLALYGRDAYGLGRVSFYSGDFRGVTFADGDGTIGGIAFTAGINAVSKAIAIHPADIASGIWIGSEGMPVAQIVNATGAIADGGDAHGTVVSVNIRSGYIIVDFDPVSATSIDSHSIKLIGQNLDYDMVGASTILQNTGTLFGINSATYDLWKGTNISLANKKLTFSKLLGILEEACDMGLDKDVEVQVPFESWVDLVDEQVALRSIDSSYSKDKGVMGVKELEYYFVNGKLKVVPNRFIRRGHALVLAEGDWHIYGSQTEPSLKVAGSDESMVNAAISSNVFEFKTVSNSQVFCHAPRRSILIKDIDPESAT